MSERLTASAMNLAADAEQFLEVRAVDKTEAQRLLLTDTDAEWMPELVELAVEARLQAHAAQPGRSVPADPQVS